METKDLNLVTPSLISEMNNVHMQAKILEQPYFMLEFMWGINEVPVSDRSNTLVFTQRSSWFVAIADAIWVGAKKKQLVVFIQSLFLSY